jgi:hypothetical protein
MDGQYCSGGQAEKVKALLGVRVKGRDIIQALKDIRSGRDLVLIMLFPGAEKKGIGLQNAYFWDIYAE